MSFREPPYIPFYKPYGMSDEEFDHEVQLAMERLHQWEAEQEEQFLTPQSGEKTESK